MSLEVLRIRSRALRGNPLGDPADRTVHLYLPPGYEASRRYPGLLALAPYMSSAGQMFNPDPLGEGLHERLDRLIRTRRMPPVVVAAPDCMTRLAGNQHINSAGTGRYEDFLLQEALPFVEARVKVSRWGVFGKSSGGYGAIVLGMRHPRILQAVAMHSGDAAFEISYLPFWVHTLDAFRAAGGPAKWLKAYEADPNRRRARHVRVLDGIGMAAHYSPNPRSRTLGIDFPFDLETGEFRPEVWRRWRAWDPVNLAARYAKNLRKLRLLYIDCGDRDDCNFHWGARALTRRLREHKVRFTYETFDDTHHAIAYRYDRSLPLLAKALSR